MIRYKKNAFLFVNQWESSIFFFQFKIYSIITILYWELDTSNSVPLKQTNLHHSIQNHTVTFNTTGANQTKSII